MRKNIDCTHIRLQCSGGKDAKKFKNRKGYFSWNVQVVCDSESKIRNIVVRCLRFCNDSHIFCSSAIKARIEVSNPENAVLLGDSGYANSNYFLIPLPREWQKKTRTLHFIPEDY